MSLTPPSLGKQSPSTGPDRVLGRGYLLSLDGLELNSRYPTTIPCLSVSVLLLLDCELQRSHNNSACCVLPANPGVSAHFWETE